MTIDASHMASLQTHAALPRRRLSLSTSAQGAPDSPRSPVAMEHHPETPSMAGKAIRAVLYWAGAYAFAVVNWCLYLGLIIRSGSWFRKHDEQEQLQLAIGMNIPSPAHPNTLAGQADAVCSTRQVLEPVEAASARLPPPLPHPANRIETTLHHQPFPRGNSTPDKQ